MEKKNKPNKGARAEDAPLNSGLYLGYESDFVEDYIKRAGDRLYYDTVSDRLFIDGAPATDIALNSFWNEVRRAHPKRKIPKTLVFDLLYSDIVKQVNPMEELVKSLRPPEPYGAIAGLADAVTPEDGDRGFFLEVMKRWLVGVIGGIFACESDKIRKAANFIPILVGPPGIGKTYFFQNLLPESFSKYHSLTVLTGDPRVDFFAISGSLVCQIDEWDMLRGTISPSYLRAILTQKSVSIRLPYKKELKTYLFRASLCATSNHSDVVLDAENNRRIIPIRIKSIDWDGYNSVDKSLLLAEALYYYKQGDTKVYFSHSELEKINQKEEYITVSLEEALVKDMMIKGGEDDIYTLTEIMVQIREMYGLNNVKSRMISHYLKKHNFEYTSKYFGSRRKWGFRVRLLPPSRPSYTPPDLFTGGLRDRDEETPF